MSKAFNLTANLILAGPNNLTPIVQSIQKSLSNIKATVDIKLASGTATKLNTINNAFKGFNTTLRDTKIQIALVSNALSTLNRTISTIQMSPLRTEINTTASAIKNLGSSIQSVKFAPLTSAIKSIQQVGKATQASSSGLEEFGRVAGLALRRFAGFTLATSVVFGFATKMREGVSEAIDFQHQLVRLAQISGTTTNAVKPLADEISRLSITWGVSSKQLMSVTDTLIQAGYSMNDTKIALEALAKASLTPTFGTMEDTVEGAIALMAQFKLKTSDLDDAFSSMNAVAAAFAVESADIITAIKIAGGAFAALSGDLDSGKESLNKFMALFTSIRATTRESASSIATGLKTIFTRLERPQTLAGFKSIGVELTDLEGKFVGQYEAITRISEAMRKMNTRDLKFASFAELLGGVRQMPKTIPALLQAEKRIQALKIAQKGTGQLTDVATKASESWNVQLTKVNENFLKLIRTISESSSFKGFITTIANLGNTFVRLGESIVPILPYLALFMGKKALTGASDFLGITGMMKGGGPKGFLAGVMGHGGFRWGDTGANDVVNGGNNLKFSHTQAVGAGNRGLSGIITRKFAAPGSLDMSTKWGYGQQAVVNAVGTGYNKRQQSLYSMGLGNLAGTNSTQEQLVLTQRLLTRGSNELAAMYGKHTPRFNEAMQMFIKSTFAAAKSNYGYIDYNNAMKDAMAVGGRPSTKFGRAMGTVGRGVGATGRFIGRHPTAALIGGMAVQQAYGAESQIGNAIGGGLVGGATMGMMGFGPAGVAAGTAYGAYTGYREATYSADKKSADAQLTSSTKALSKAFDDLGKKVNEKNIKAFEKALEDSMGAQDALNRADIKNFSGDLANLSGGGSIAEKQARSEMGYFGYGWNRMKSTGEAMGHWVGTEGGLFGGKEAQTELEDLEDRIAKERSIRYRENNKASGDNAQEAIGLMVKKGMTEEQILGKTSVISALGRVNATKEDVAAWELNPNSKDTIKDQISRGNPAAKTLIREEQEKQKFLNKLADLNNIMDVQLAQLTRTLEIANDKLEQTSEVGRQAMATSGMIGSIRGGNISAYNYTANIKAAAPNAYSGKELADEYTNMSKTFGMDAGKTAYGASVLSSSQNLNQAINGIIERLSNSKNPDAKFDVEKLMAEAIEKSGVSGEAKNIIDKIIEKETATGQSGDTSKTFDKKDAVEKLKKLNVLTELAKPLLENIVKMYGAQSRIEKDILDARIQFLQIQNSINEKVADQQLLKGEQKLTLQGVLRPGYRATAEESYAPMKSKLETMALNTVGVATTNPNVIGQDLIELRKKLSVQQDIIKANPANIVAKEESMRLINQITKEQKLLEILHTDNTKQTGILNELNQIQQKREAAQSTVQDIALMDPNARGQLQRQLQAYAEYQQTGKLQGGVRGQEAIKGGQFMARSGLLTPEQTAEFNRRITGAILDKNNFKGDDNGLGLGARKPGDDPRGRQLLADLKGDMSVKLTSGNILINNEKQNLEIQAGVVNIRAGELGRARENINKPPMAMGGIVKGMASGGFINSTDTQPAMLTPGEFVVREPIARRNYGALSRLNNTGQMGSEGNGSINFGAFETTAIRLANSLDNFAKLNIPEKISIVMSPMNITHTLTGDSSLGNAIVSMISSTLDTMITNKLRTVINPDTGETNAMGMNQFLGGSK